MMDDTTVQTTPESQPPRGDGMTPTATYPMNRMSSGVIGPVGVELVIACAGVDLPETGIGQYLVALHTDGSHCPLDCGCIGPEHRTSIWEGHEVDRGEWTWHGSRYVLIGWRKSGPTKAEAQLQERIEELSEDVAHERGLHQVTKADLGHCIRRIEKLQDRRSRLRQSVRRSRLVAADAHRYGIALQAAWVGWSAAIILVAHLIESGLS